MSSTPAPHTPDSTPRKTALTRSFTLPSKVASTTSRTKPTAEIGATEGVETLYIHPNSTILKFTCAAPARPSSSASPGGQLGQGTLPWATRTEQTLAAGPLEIYRVPGSVSFLHSGSLLHAILPRSNCWCVDGVSKFAMRVLADTYYRIELPGDSPEDLEKVEEFKETLKKVLFYERTACPFARTFTVDLPEEPKVRKKKKRYHGPAKKWKLEKAYSWRPEDGGERPLRDSEPSSGSVSASDEEGSSSADEQSDTSEAADRVTELTVTTPSRPSVRDRARGFNLRSVTAPPQMALQSTPPSRLRTSYVVDGAGDDGTDGARSPDHAPSALDPSSLHPFQAIPTDMPPSPPDSSAGFEFAEAPTQATLVGHGYEAARHSNISTHTRNDEDVIATQANQSEEVGLPALFSSSPNQWHAHSVAEQESEAAKPLASPASSLPPRPTHEESGHLLVTEEHSQEPSLGSSPDSRGQTGPESKTAPLQDIEAESDNKQPTERHLEDAEDVEVAEDIGDTENAEHVADVPVTDAQDPFAQIQARIQARRSIGGTTSFVPNPKSPTRQSSASTASSGSSLASTRSGASRRPHPSQQQQQAFASALVRKACATFLGPPAHLVMIMLRIAARFAKGALPSALLFESPAGTPKRVPGSFDLDGSDVEDFGLDDLDDLEWEEDDFGVPLRSPVRLANVSAVSSAVREHIRGRGAWSVADEDV